MFYPEIGADEKEFWDLFSVIYVFSVLWYSSNKRLFLLENKSVYKFVKSFNIRRIIHSISF